MIGVIKGTMRQKKEVNGLPLPIASYKANMKAPIRSLKVAITAKQSGSGTPAPDNIRPFIGVSECNVCNTPMPVSPLWTIDSSFNGTVAFNQLVPDNKIHLSETVESDVDSTKWGRTSASLGNTFANHVVLAVCNVSNSKCFPAWANVNQKFVDVSSGSIEQTKSASVYKPTSSQTGSIKFRLIAGLTSGTYTADIQLFDLTQMFGSTIADYIYSLEHATTGAGVEFFRSIYPNDYYEYDAGTDEMVGSREGNTYTIQLGDTYYGCILNATNGELTIDKKGRYVDSELSISYDATNQRFFITLPDMANNTAARNKVILCSTYDNKVNVPYEASWDNVIYNAGGDRPKDIAIHDRRYTTVADFVAYASQNCFIAYPLATPITVQLTPTQVEQFLVNNVFADTGDVKKLEYFDRQVYYGR